MFGMFLNSRRTLTMTRNSLSRAAPRGLGAVGSEGVDASASVSVDLVEDAFVAMNLFPSEDAVGKYFRQRSCQRLRDMSDDPRNQSHHRLTATRRAGRYRFVGVVVGGESRDERTPRLCRELSICW